MPRLDQPARGLRPLYAERWPLFANIPWFPSIGDGAANNIGCGCDTPNEFALMVGTTGAMRAVFERPTVDIPEGLWCYRLDPRRFVLGGALSNGGKVFEWVMERFQMPNDWEHQLSQITPGSHGLTVLPLFAGERSTKWRADARGAITGLNLNTTPVEILAASLESVALRFRLLYEILADRLGAPQRVIATGAAMLALERIGAVSHLSEIPSTTGDTFLPRPQFADAYARLLDNQKTLYRRLFETP
jgi:gluconokinase